MKKYFMIFALFLVAFFSCKKEINTNGNLGNQQTIQKDSALLFLDNAKSDSLAEESFYIKANFNGHDLCFTTTGNTLCHSYFVDTFMNVFYIYHKKDSSTTDNLYLLRQNSSQSIMIELYCGQTHILNRNFPYYQPNNNLEHCEFSEIQLINMNGAYSSNVIQNSPQDNYTFWATTGFGVTITFTGRSPDNIVEGKFEGTIKTNTGSVVRIKDGTFRIKFVISNDYLNI